jgi:hypothetical protein
MDYNHHRPHRSLDYMALAAFATACFKEGSAPPSSKQGDYTTLKRKSATQRPEPVLLTFDNTKQ